MSRKLRAVVYVMRVTVFDSLSQADFARGDAPEGCETLKLHFQAHASHYGLNVNTLLSPEPLNQYSRIAMLFELLPAAPYKITPQIFDWSPLNYSAYFATSRHPAKGFIMAAWAYAPRTPKTRFGDALDLLHKTSVNAISAFRLIVAHGRLHEGRALCQASSQSIRDMVERARKIACES